MGSRGVAMVVVIMTAVTAVAAAAGAGPSPDLAACSDQLAGLVPCLQYVTEAAKAPSKECCTNLNAVIKTSTKCVCVLIKENSGPDLTINKTLAASLTIKCGVPPKYSLESCVDLLHLPPNSTDAQFFRSLNNSTKNSTVSPPGTALPPGPAATASASSGNPASGKNASTTAPPPPKSGADGSRVAVWGVGIQTIVGAMVLLLNS